jgi:hypothetical protein
MSWVCPRCQRTFSSEGQFHSHDVLVADRHFAGRPADPRVTRVDRVSSGKFAGVVEVREPGDIDGELRGWLTEAYRLRAGFRRQRPVPRLPAQPGDRRA